MIVGSLARRYAKALLASCLAQNVQDKVCSELLSMAALYQEQVSLREALENAIFPMSQRQKVLQMLAQRMAVSKLLLHLLQLLLERGKISYVPAIAKEFLSLLDNHMGRIRAKVTTAASIDQATEQKLISVFESVSGKRVILEKAEDQSLIGGFVLQVKDVIYDGSVVAQLETLRLALSSEVNTILLS